VPLREAAFILAAVLMRLLVVIAISIAVIAMLTMWIVEPVTSAAMALTGARRGPYG
jgi:predicted membrane chloride channel (bestrophin family)